MIDKYKQYQKHKEETIKEHKKRQWHQPELPFHQNTKEEFYSSISKSNRRLTSDEIEDLFWGLLANVGWKLDDSHIVLVCKDCDKSLFIVAKASIDQSKETKISYLANPTNHLDRHKAECKAIGEADE